jgi:hypothetical protein
MASMGGGNRLDWEKASRLLKAPGMVNRVLQQICSAEGLNKNGVKADLQFRITQSRFEWAGVRVALLVTFLVFSLSISHSRNS